ncbi:MAG: imidazolonepropionase [Bacteriovoracaceae bacterium]
MKVYSHITQLLTLAGAHQKDGRKLLDEDLSIVEDAAIVMDDNLIHWVGKTQDLPSDYEKIPRTNLSEHIVTPEIVDSHTHLVFGGNRSFEYGLRLKGASYEEIAAAGGGILHTADKTAHLSEEELFKTACQRVDRIHSYGVGTIEIKSGYGLTFEAEYKISKIINKLKDHFKGRVQIIRTYMAAHAVPKSFKDSAHFVNEVVLPLMEKLHSEKMIDIVDVFHEKNYFTDEDTRFVFEKALALGLHVKMHADEMNDNNGASLATEYSALSADHLLQVSDEGIRALAKSSTVATLLPGTAFFLGKALAPARHMIEAGVKVAMASDYNPGSCHCDNLILLASISAKNLAMTPVEIWAAITLNASHALNLREQGAVIPGLEPKLSIFKASTHEEIFYSWGHNLAIKI